MTTVLLIPVHHRIAVVMMLQKNCVVPPRNEEVGMGNRDLKNRKERDGAGLGRVSCGIS